MYTKYVALRDKKGLTDAKVSKQTGISPSTFSDWKAGRSNPKLEKLLKLSEFFGVSVETFIKEEV